MLRSLRSVSLLLLALLGLAVGVSGLAHDAYTAAFGFDLFLLSAVVLADT